MFGLSPIRLYAYLAVFLVIAGILAHDKYLSIKVKEKAAQVKDLTRDLVNERNYRIIEIKDRKQADETAKSLEDELARIRSAPKPVSVYCRPAHLPAASEGGAAPGVAGAAAGPGAEEPLQDIGLALSDVWIEHETNAARARALIEWERGRTH
jgi:hypothetical protein